MTRLADEIMDELESAGITGGSTGWSGFIGRVPTDPDQAITLFETPGTQPETDADTNNYDYPSFQVQVRGEKHERDVVRDKAQEVFDQLHDVSISGWVYLFANSGPWDLGYDLNDRPQMVLNFRGMRQRA